MTGRHKLTMLGSILVVFGLIERRWWLLGSWFGFSFLALGFAHFLGGHGLLGKRVDGTLSPWSWVLFLPLLTSTLVVWHLIRLLSREPACNVVTGQLVVGRRLLPSECREKFDNFVDLTAEFSEPAAIRTSQAYLSFPILDGGAPTPESLRSAVSSLRPGRTFVHCAQGHGRTGLFALAVLLSSGTALTVEEGLQMLSAARPAIRLSPEQHRCIRSYARDMTEGT